MSGAWKSPSSPESWGTAVGHCGKAACVAVTLDFVLGSARIAPIVLQCSGGSNGAGRPRTPWSECGRAH